MSSANFAGKNTPNRSVRSEARRMQMSWPHFALECTLIHDDKQCIVYLYAPSCTWGYFLFASFERLLLRLFRLFSLLRKALFFPGSVCISPAGKLAFKAAESPKASLQFRQIRPRKSRAYYRTDTYLLHRASQNFTRLGFPSRPGLGRFSSCAFVFSTYVVTHTCGFFLLSIWPTLAINEPRATRWTEITHATRWDHHRYEPE